MKKVIFLYFYVHFKIINADNLDEGNGRTYYYLQDYIDPLPEGCSDILDTFAQYASHFTNCSIRYARPIRLCENCIDHYMQFTNEYEKLISTVVNGTSCREMYISHDRLDAVLWYHDSISSVWNKGNCNACYDWSEGKPELSKNTTRFNMMFNETQLCIKKYLNPYKNNSEEVCEKCMQLYVQLDEYYKKLSTDSIGVDSICMDIVDLMNATRSTWSKSLNCCKLRRSPQIIFLCCTGIISFLPLLFYVAVRYCGPIRDLPNVLKQSRFKQSLLRSMDSRIN